MLTYQTNLSYPVASAAQQPQPQPQMAGAAAGTQDQIQAQWAEYYRQIGYAYYGQQPGQQQVQPGQQPQPASAVPGQEPKVCIYTCTT